MKQDQRKRAETETEMDTGGLPVIRVRVAGIDLGSRSHWVCAPTVEGTGREVAQFGATTPELERMAQWLKERLVESVAMEGTGTYWIPVHEVLEGEKFEVLLVCTRDLANVPGRRKTDRIDSRWIQRLHSCGLLRGSFRPPEQICMLRTLVRDKGNLIDERSDWLRRMQKSLDQMNVRVHRAVSDLQGATGMAIIRAIVKGERDPRKLAKLRDANCHRSEEEIAEQLSGHWREDYLFSLEQSLRMYEAVNERIAAYEKEMLRRLTEMERPECQGQSAPRLKNANKAKKIRERGEEPMHQAFFRISGVDLAAIDSVGVGVVEAVLSEYGPDLSRFPSEKEFVAHLNLAPNRSVTGGKPIPGKRSKRGMGSSRVREALRSAVLSLRHSQTALGAYFRHLSQRLGADVAGFATARKVAQYIYRLLRWGHEYVDEGAQAYEERYQLARLHRTKQQAATLGYELTPKPVKA